MLFFCFVIYHHTDYIYCELRHAVARTYKLMGSKNYSSKEVEVVPIAFPAGHGGGRVAWGSQGSWGSGKTRGTADLVSPRKTWVALARKY